MMARRLLGLGALLLAAGCASTMTLGSRKGGEVVEAEGSAAGSEGQAREEAALADARGKAVERVWDVFLSTAVRAAQADRLRQKVLAKAGDYVEKVQVLEKKSEPGRASVRVRALVSLAKLGKDLEALGLSKPEGVKGRPGLLISLKETGPGAGREVGRASDFLRRALAERGYAAADFSDIMGKNYQKTGEAGEALAEARRSGAELLLTGEASAAPVADGRLEGYKTFKAEVSFQAVSVSSGEALSSWTAQATAVDAAEEASASKALENAGELAAERLRSWLATRYRERTELSVLVAGLEDLGQARRFIESARGIPSAAGAVLEGFSDRQALIKIYVERISAEELAAWLLKNEPFSLEVRSVEPELGSLELEAKGPR